MRFEKNYAQYYDLFNQGKDYKKEADFLEEVFRKYGNKIMSILDLGCGTGLHTKELVGRGYNVTGLDLSKEMLEIAKKRNPDSDFFIEDMSNFNINKKFDVIICMFAALGYLTENIQLEGFFKCCKSHLKEDGLLVLDVWNGLGVMNELPTSREKIAEIENLKIMRKSFPSLDSKNQISNVKFLVKVSEKNQGKEKLITEYNEDHKVRFFFPLELKKYIEDSDLKVLHICPSYNLNENLTEKHWNMVIIGR